MGISLDRIDFNREEIINEMDVVIKTQVTSVDIKYTLTIEGHELDGETTVSLDEYNGFTGYDDIIGFIETQVKEGIQ